MAPERPTPRARINSEAVALAALLRCVHEADKAVDVGVPFIACDLSGCSKQVQPWTAGNDVREEGEIYAAAIRRLENEESAFVRSGGSASRPFTELVSANTAFRVPWLVSDFDPRTITDDQILLDLVRRIEAIKRDIASAGFLTETKGFNTELMRRLVLFMRSSDGLAINAVGLAPTEMVLLDFLRLPAEGRKGDCTELSRLGYTVFRLAGLKTSFVDVQMDTVDPSITQHTTVAVALDPADPNAWTTVDLYHDGWISREGHERQSLMPEISALAVFEGSRALHAMRSKAPSRADEPQIEEAFRRAIGYDPFYPLTHYNYSFFLKDWKKDKAGALGEAQRAATLRPFDIDFAAFASLLAQ